MVGCGNISSNYLAHAPIYADDFAIVACCDLDGDRARAVAETAGARALALDDVLADPTIDAVLLLTQPASHAPLALRAIAAGKHTYTEKPLATNRGDAEAVAAAAAACGVLAGCAPDTFLAAPFQAARQAVANGVIGEIVAVSMTSMYGTPETWHPDPSFLYAVGAGPLFDMGPYFLQLLEETVGPVSSVRAATLSARPTRTVASGPLAGTTFTAETPTHVSAVLELERGGIATLVASFEVPAHRMPYFQIHGTAGTLDLPDPNQFTGETMLHLPGVEPRALANTGGVPGRGAGLADLARAVREGREPRASAARGARLVATMEAILNAS